MTNAELCKWLRENSSGVYRPAFVAADRIEELEEKYNALKEAVRPVVTYYLHRKARDTEFGFVAHTSSLLVGGQECCITYGQLDALAALVGEG